MVIPMALLVALALAPAAEAATTVVYAGDPGTAVERAAADAGLRVWELNPVRVTDLPKGFGPVAVGAGQPAGCTGERVNNAAIRELVGKVEARIAYQQDYEAALTDLEAASAALPCLGELAEASLGGRLFFLQGVSAAGLGKNDVSKAAFLRVLSFQPGLEWDAKFSPKLRGPFDEAVATEAAAPKRRILVGPGLADAPTLMVDGRLLTPVDGWLEVADGPHLVQLLGPPVATIPVVASERPLALMIPSALSEAVVAEVANPTRQVLLQAMIDGNLPGDTSVYVWTGDATWRAGTWEALPASQALAAGKRREIRARLTVAGTITGGVGAVAAVAGVGLWAASRGPAGPEETEAFGARMARQGAGAALFDAGAVGLAAGLGCVVVGVTW